MSVPVKNYFDNTQTNDNKFHMEGSADILRYNTDEVEIGTWVDGSTIYRKTVAIGAMPSATTKNVAHGIANLNLNSFIKGELNAYKTTGTDSPLNFGGLQAGTFTVTTTNIVITTGDTSFAAYNATYATLYYTKTA